MTVQVTIKEYSDLYRRIGFLEGSLEGLLCVTNDHRGAIKLAIERYELQFNQPIAQRYSGIKGDIGTPLLGERQEQ